VDRGYVVLPLVPEGSIDEVSDKVRVAIDVDMAELLPLRKAGERRTFDPAGKLSGSINFHKDVRSVRCAAHDAAKALLECVVALGRNGELPFSLSSSILRNPAVACCPDAVLSRPPSDKQQPNWHRDFTSASQEAAGEALILGGWVNLDRREIAPGQHFVCVPKSHMLLGSRELVKPVPGAEGFVKLDPVETLQAAEAAETVTVPPGHLLLFIERMAHAVANVPPRPRQLPVEMKKRPMTRLFVGEHLSTEGAAVLYPGLTEALTNKAQMPIKSGQVLPCLPRYGPYKASKQTKQRALAWIDAHVKPALREEVKAKLDASDPLKAAWPAMTELPFEYCSMRFPELSDSEKAMFLMQPL